MARLCNVIPMLNYHTFFVRAPSFGCHGNDQSTSTLYFLALTFKVHGDHGVMNISFVRQRTKLQMHLFAFILTCMTLLNYFCQKIYLSFHVDEVRLKCLGNYCKGNIRQHVSISRDLAGCHCVLSKCHIYNFRIFKFSSR